MDLLIILGLVLVVVFILLGDILEDGNLLYIIYLSLVIIIVFILFFVVMIGMYVCYVKVVYKEIKIVFLNFKINLNEIIKNLVELVILVRKDGVLSLEG